jgi:phosphoribosylanthranilate isomerase
MVRVKVCGITNLDDARLAVAAGADALGFIFVERTPRYVTPAAAAALVEALPPFVTPVGVFWDHAPAHVKAVAEECRLGALQFHGAEPPDALTGYRLPTIKTIKMSAGEPDAAYPLADVGRYEVSAFLLDSVARWSEGEMRAPLAWRAVAGWLQRLAKRKTPVILSAGLTPDNVADAIRTVRPWGVDVNSGVEARPGRKDPDKLVRFVREAKSAAPAAPEAHP